MALVLPPSFLQNVTQAAGHTAQGDRLTIGSGYQPGTAPLSGRSGILPGPPNGMGELSLLSATVVRVQAFRAVVQGTQDSRQGQYVATNDAAVDLTIGAQASGVTRRDLIVAYVRDSAYTPTTQNDWLLTVIPGTPASSNPQLPATPINAMLLGEVLVAATGGTNQLTSYNPRTAAVGGITPVAAADVFSGAYDGQYRDRNRKLERWNSALGLWLPQLGGRQVYDGVYQTQAQAFTSGIAQWIQFAFQGKLLAPGSTASMWSASFPQRLTAPVKGYYIFGGGGTFDPDARGERGVRIALNGVSVPFGTVSRVKASDQAATSVPLRTCPIQLNAGDYVEMQGLVNLGTTGTINSGLNLTSGETSSFWGYLLEETV